MATVELYREELSIEDAPCNRLRTGWRGSVAAMDGDTVGLLPRDLVVQNASAPSVGCDLGCSPTPCLSRQVAMADARAAPQNPRPTVIVVAQTIGARCERCMAAPGHRPPCAARRTRALHPRRSRNAIFACDHRPRGQETDRQVAPLRRTQGSATLTRGGLHEIPK